MSEVIRDEENQGCGGDEVNVGTVIRGTRRSHRMIVCGWAWVKHTCIQTTN